MNYESVGSHYSGTDLVYTGEYSGMYDSNSVTLKHDWQINDQWSNSMLYRTTKEQSSWLKFVNGVQDKGQMSLTDLEYKIYSDNFKYQTDRYTMVGGLEYTKGRDNKENQETNNTSMFLQGDWEIVPHVTLSGGIRHDRLTASTAIIPSAISWAGILPKRILCMQAAAITTFCRA